MNDNYAMIDGKRIEITEDTYNQFKALTNCDTYEDICTKLFTDEIYCTNEQGLIIKTGEGVQHNIDDPNNASSKRQLMKLLAINKLMNVAKYLNNGWTPDWNDHRIVKYFLWIETDTNSVGIDISPEDNLGAIYFKSEKFAEQAIAILGGDAIRLALTSEY